RARPTREGRPLAGAGRRGGTRPGKLGRACGRGPRGSRPGSLSGPRRPVIVRQGRAAPDARGAGARRRDRDRPEREPTMRVLLVQPSRLEPDGSVYKNSTRWLLGMTLPYVAALTPPGVDVVIRDDLYEDIPFDGRW